MAALERDALDLDRVVTGLRKVVKRRSEIKLRYFKGSVESYLVVEDFETEVAPRTVRDLKGVREGNILTTW